MTNNTNSDLNNIVPTETAAANDVSDGIIFTVVNSANDASRKVKLFPENSLLEMLELCGDIGLKKEDASQYIFEYNGSTTSDKNETIGNLKITPFSKLLVNPNGKVA